MKRTLVLHVFAKSDDLEKYWGRELQSALKDIFNLIVQLRSDRSAIGMSPEFTDLSGCIQVALVDLHSTDLQEVLGSIDRKEKYVFLVTDKANQLPDLYLKNEVDDLIVTPFRMVEVITKLKAVETFMGWRKLEQMNVSLAQVLESLEESYRLAERTQKASLPKKFPKVKGFKVESRYLAGAASGGDYFDIFEIESAKSLCTVLSHSNTYRVSSAFLSSLSEAVSQYSKEHEGGEIDPAAIVDKLQGALRPSFREKDQLSLCLGVISRNQGLFHYVTFGESVGFYSDPGQEFRALNHSQGAWVGSDTTQKCHAFKVPLSPKGRLVFISRGFINSIGGVEEVQRFLNEFSGKDALDILNELAFIIKSKISKEIGLPERDCTALVIDIDSLMLKAED